MRGLELKCEGTLFGGLFGGRTKTKTRRGNGNQVRLVGRVLLPAIVSTSVNCGNVCVREIIPKWPSLAGPEAELLVKVADQIRKEKRFGLINEDSKEVKHPSSHLPGSLPHIILIATSSLSTGLGTEHRAARAGTGTFWSGFPCGCGIETMTAGSCPTVGKVRIRSVRYECLSPSLRSPTHTS